MGADRVAHWRSYLATAPRYEDEVIAVYSTLPEAGRDFELMAQMAPGLGPVRTIVSANCLNPGSAMEINVAWGSSGPLDQNYDVTVSLVDDAGHVHQTEEYPLSTVWPTSEWTANSLAWGYYPLFLAPSIPEGEYNIKLQLLDANTGRSVGDPVLLEPVAVQAAVCNLAENAEAKDVNAVFGDQLRLLEYETRRNDGLQNVTLYWRSERRMETDYMIFVHIFDPATGIPVAQDDAMPHRSAYPTTFWWPGETVADLIPISLNGVPPGSYGIAVGVYEPSTGERLSLVNSLGQLIPDGRLVLDEIVEIE